MKGQKKFVVRGKICHSEVTALELAKRATRMLLRCALAPELVETFESGDCTVDSFQFGLTAIQNQANGTRTREAQVKMTGILFKGRSFNEITVTLFLERSPGKDWVASRRGHTAEYNHGEWEIMFEHNSPFIKVFSPDCGKDVFLSR